MMRSLKALLPFAPQKPNAFISQELSRWNDERSKMRPEHFSVFQPDILLPLQYHRTRRTRHLLLPEQKLAVAILEDAIACYQHYARSRGERAEANYREAEEWIMKPERHWLFSFERICELIALNPDYIRAGLKRWRAQHVTNPGGRAIQPLRTVQQRSEKITRPQPRAQPKRISHSRPMHGLP